MATARRERVAAVARRLATLPEWPLISASLLAGIAMMEMLARPYEQGDAVSLLLFLALGATLPVAFAAKLPVLATVTITAATFGTQAAGQPPTVAGSVALLGVLYLTASRRPWGMATLVVLPYVVFVLAAPGRLDGIGRLWSVTMVPVLFAAIVLGRAHRLREERAERAATERDIATTLMEHAARGERARIARELHDVVAHHISMISVQAETARLTTPGMPDEGAHRLVAIADTARTALTEMRRLLGVLREDAGGEPTRRPQPGLYQINELLDEARDTTGASTRLIVHGDVVPLDPGVELTAYRVVQEALTNARRHAPGAAVDVELEYAPDALRLRVRDNGPGPPADGVSGGHGMLGMRERVATAGGTLRTGPAPLTGFLVEAVLPVMSRVPAQPGGTP